MKRITVFLYLCILITATYADTRLLRFPTIYDDQILFTYAGDLYTVADTGGIGRKLTSAIGFEMFARYSPDGKQIAFTGQYDGNTEVFLMPSEGGQPIRLSYTATLSRDDVSDRMGPNNIVMGWTPDGKNIIFRSRRNSWDPFVGQLLLISPQGGMTHQLPLPEGGFCSYSPDGTRLAYNRIFREFRTWKRYRGGMADDIWIYDFNTKQISNITNNPAQDIIPMWHGDNIYFLSDRDEQERMNLYVYNISSGETRRLTDFSDFDIKFPSLGKKAIVFEKGGYIYRFDLQNEKTQNVSITVANDMIYGRNEIKQVSKNITNYEISPDGMRALFGARGDIFTVPASQGQTRNLTRTSAVHERNSKWSPDGQWIAFVSDASGEDEITILKPGGGHEPIQITTGGVTYKYQPYWSADSKKLLWSDRLQRLRYVDIDSRKITEVAKSEVWEIRDYCWSPDSRWVAYAKPDLSGMDAIYIYSLDDQQTYPVTTNWYDSYNPAFSSDGKYLYFTSERDFNPIFSETEWNNAYIDMQRIYLVTLAKDVKSPFEPKSDEVELKKEAEKKPKKNMKVEVKIDPDGIEKRIIGLPITPSQYRHITALESTVYYIRKGYTDKKPLLLMYDLKEKKETELGHFNGYEISADQKKMIVGQPGSYAIIVLPKTKIEIKKKLDLAGMEMNLDREAEWMQIFKECWRQMRDYFYAPNMAGVDWKAIEEKYQPLIPFVKQRADLTYIIGEMIGELSTGHTYVGGGDEPKPKRIKTGLLGAVITRDNNSGYYRIDKILAGANWDSTLRSPLTEIGVNVEVGNYILAIDGKPTTQMKNIYEALVDKADKQVKLKINNQASEKGSREVTVIPIADESQLYYHDWVQGNIKKVNEATGGKVGYVHIPDMGTDGLNTFAKYFYPQLRKKALIVDVRDNGGGNVSPIIIERLHRQIQMIEKARNSLPDTDPHAMVWGPKVCLMNQYSASDGDIFPYRFRKLNLGKLIGRRTWGGVVGIRETLPLVDGGFLNKPEFASYNVEGTKWIIEGHGVDPDIYVDNDPVKQYEGIDQQLDKAIEVILEELKTQEKTIPPPPPYPGEK
jgi:tricorn protease